MERKRKKCGKRDYREEKPVFSRNSSLEADARASFFKIRIVSSKELPKHLTLTTASANAANDNPSVS
jgi:hypothetical protein